MNIPPTRFFPRNQFLEPRTLDTWPVVVAVAGRVVSSIVFMACLVAHSQKGQNLVAWMVLHFLVRRLMLQFFVRRVDLVLLAFPDRMDQTIVLLVFCVTAYVCAVRLLAPN